MIEHCGDIWEFRKPEDFICITTCGVINSRGDLVMGRGIALEAKQRYPKLPTILGGAVKFQGMRVEIVASLKLIAFPTKAHYKEKSSINLILRSTLQLLEKSHNIQGRILLPRPGCSNGRLDGLRWNLCCVTT